MIEQARFGAGFSVDRTLLEPLFIDRQSREQVTEAPRGIGTQIPFSRGEVASGPRQLPSNTTFGEAYNRYMQDPTNAWSERTRETYETCRRVAVSIIDEMTLIEEISRAHIRDFIDVIRFMPRNAAKRFPKLSAREASDRMRLSDAAGLMSAANANAYINSLSSFLNWAVNEELLHRNPARGLRLPDDTAKREKRHPFSRDQLKTIFDTPLYRGCLNGERGYAVAGSERPQNARYWVPLIALHTGMRLNEICQLDVTDIEIIEGIACISVRNESLVGNGDKRLKTTASKRIIPIHRTILGLGFIAYVAHQSRKGQTKLFSEIETGPKGARSIAFSKWFTQLLRRSGASRDRTCFHSFRHNFRDELRIARIDHDIAMALGGWTGGSSDRNKVSENYGHGHRVSLLYDAVNHLEFSEVDLSHLRRE